MTEDAFILYIFKINHVSLLPPRMKGYERLKKRETDNVLRLVVALIFWRNSPTPMVT